MLTKTDIEHRALVSFESSSLKQDKKTWDVYKQAFCDGYMNPHKEIRIKLDTVIEMVDKLTMEVSDGNG